MASEQGDKSMWDGYSKDERCSNCRFGNHPTDNDEPTLMWICRRYPPVVPVTINKGQYNMEEDNGEYLEADLDGGAFWPRVDGSDWCGEFQPRKTEEKPDESVRHAGFSVRTRNCLSWQKITMVSQVCALTEDELRDFRNVGDKVIDDIRATLAKLGKSLKGEPPPTSPA